MPAPKNVPRLPTISGQQHAVFPNCRDRALLEGQPAIMGCHLCNGLFDVGWNEPHTASG